MPFTCAFADVRGIVRSVPRVGTRRKFSRLNQFARRNLSKYDRSVLALQLEPLYAAEAKRRQAATQFGSTVVQNSAPPQDTGKTVEKLAKLAGTSRDTIRKVKNTLLRRPAHRRDSARAAKGQGQPVPAECNSRYTD